MPDQALSDVKVLDFTHHVAGPYCTKLLADYGADVVKVERPGGGDLSRRMGPFPEDIPHGEKSGLFLHLNTNKRGITLDLGTQAAVKIVKELVKETDLVVESFRPGVMERFGLDYASLKEINPRLVMTSISNFGQTGPYRDFRAAEIMFYGMGGEMYSTGQRDREPLKMAANVVLYQAGAAAAVATMGAVYAAMGQGAGQQVDVSIMETQVGSIDRRMSNLVAFQYTGETIGRGPFNTSGYPNGVYQCDDGYFQISGARSYFPRVIRMLGEPEALTDARWTTSEAQRDAGMKAEFEEYFLAWIKPRSKYDAWRSAQDARVLSGPLNNIGDLMQDPVFNERGAFADISHPEAGELKYPGRPFIMQESPWSVERPAPLLGQHNGDILGNLGYSGDDIVRLKQQGVI